MDSEVKAKIADAVGMPLDELHRQINTKWNELQELLDVLANHHKIVMGTLEATAHMHSNPTVMASAPGRG